MRRVLAFILIGLTLLSGRAQGSEFSDQTWNFGEVHFWRNDTARFKVRNGTTRNLIFLPTYYNENFTIMFSNRAAEPGETIEISIVYYTEKKGRFDVSVPLYINQKPDPIQFRLRGNIKGFDPSAQLRCPSVNDGPEPEKLQKLITIQVRDRQTNELLVADMIQVRNGANRKVDLVRENMDYEMSVEPGSFRIEARKNGYDDYLAMIQLEPYQNLFTVYLDRLAPPEVVTEDPVPAKDPDREAAVKDSLDRLEHRKNREWTSTDTSGKYIERENPDVHKHPDTIPAEHPVIPEPVKSTGLNNAEYKFNNVILIVDVSASMNRYGKLDRLKSSFNVLIDGLRPEDQVAIITMASDASLVQPPVHVEEKDSLKARMGRMKANGSTNAGAAMDLAYRLAYEHFIEGGNNQIILATDGVFYGGSMTRHDMEKRITSGNEKGIHLSTIALGTDPKAVMFLQDLSSKGGGSFVQVTENDADQNGLLEMIKTQSRK